MCAGSNLQIVAATIVRIEFIAATDRRNCRDRRGDRLWRGHEGKKVAATIATTVAETTIL